MQTISITVFGKVAKIIEKEIGLEKVGDISDINTKIMFEKLSAEGRSKILLTFDV